MVTFRNKHKILLFLFFLLLASFVGGFFPAGSSASALALKSIDCPERYVTLINPVRGRNLWADKTLRPIKDQYQAISTRGMGATWLFTYDSLIDGDVVAYAKEFSRKNENGIFLEVTRNLLEEAKVPYNQYLRWSDPGIVFLSAYSQNERKILINTVMRAFYSDFGYYPKSIGAWWIDSYSMKYLKEKFGVEAALIVADQKVTDSYGIWGQWWGYPYIASDENILVPAKETIDVRQVVVLQWAQRDFVRAYGGGGKYSLYSLQANDYPRVGEDINYFVTLASNYLSCINKVGQITVGLETGQESLEAWPEYLRQLDVLQNSPNVAFVTMAGFAERFKNNYPRKVSLGSWNLSLEKRENELLGEETNYPSDISFSDYFVKDISGFLRRYESDLLAQRPVRWFWWWVLALPFVYIFLKRDSQTKIFVPFVLFLVSSYSLLLFSYQKYGWSVFLGPKVEPLILWQAASTIFCFVIFYFPSRLSFVRKRLHGVYFWMVSLVYGLDYLLSLVRYSFLSGAYYIGIIIEKNRFIGFTFREAKLAFGVVNYAMPINQAVSFLKFPFDKIYANSIYYLIFYPVAHIVIAIVVCRLYIKSSKTIQRILLFVFAIFFVGFVINMYNSEPRGVFAIY